MARRFLPLIGVLLFGCASSAEHSETLEPAQSALNAPQAKPSLQSRPVIVSIQTRDEILRIHGGGRFSVVRSDGVVVAREVDASALKRGHEDLFELYQNAFARGGAWLDARVHEIAPEENADIR